MNDRLEKQIKFILEIDKLKEIKRQTLIADGSRQENDTEHSWHLAMMCMLLSEYANKDIDMLRVMKMVLIHDIIEIDAGDTYAYDTIGNETKRQRETKAADRLFAILPKDQEKELRELWDEFEEKQTGESLFANSLDKIQPILLNNASGGISWREHGVHKEQIINRNSRTHEGSEELWNYCLPIIDKNVEKGNIKQ